MIHGSSYGEDHADVYDALYEDRDDIEQICDVLAALGRGGPVLELGVGTGRIAVPLARRGIQVMGVDNSPQMLARLAARQDGHLVEALLGDAVEIDLGRSFGLVFVAFSTLFLLGTQQAQVRCFRNVARHLSPGGRFLVEGFIHDRREWSGTQQFVVTKVDDRHVAARAAIHDPISQTIRTQAIEMRDQSVRYRPNCLRYVWPAEMDLMAELAGLQFSSRWRDWHRQPVEASSTQQIAVYIKPLE